MLSLIEYPAFDRYLRLFKQTGNQAHLNMLMTYVINFTSVYLINQSKKRFANFKAEEEDLKQDIYVEALKYIHNGLFKARYPKRAMEGLVRIKVAEFFKERTKNKRLEYRYDFDKFFIKGFDFDFTYEHNLFLVTRLNKYISPLYFKSGDRRKAIFKRAYYFDNAIKEIVNELKKKPYLEIEDQKFFARKLKVGFKTVKFLIDFYTEDIKKYLLGYV